ncbi:uncharacterized protein LOC108819759 [Raphanus sativus]|uniref:Uncharacterized protein LOC108819759 n=1 Tax=Raphanus sativus TaxID=3726 RepID=A0A6J0KMP0_RAPSA|nr:uncharacterized protein LOC108819759 [Raphanus sativus]
MNLSDHHTSSSENPAERLLPRFLLPNSAYGQGNGFTSRDRNVFETSLVKARRKMIIDLQLPADQYLDDTNEITICPPIFKRSKSGRGDDASHRSNSSGSCLDVRNSNGLLADLNEPLICQDSEPLSLSRDTYSHYRRHSADVATSENGWMVLDAAGHDRNTQRDLRMPSHSLQLRSNNAVQPQSYPTPDYSNVIAYREMEARSVNPQASYDSYVESSMSSSNAPRLHNDYRTDDFVTPWSHRSSSSCGNPRSSSQQKPYLVQTNPYMNFVTHARADSSSEMRIHAISNWIHHGFSSGQSFENLQGPKKQECSAAVLPWLKPNPTYKSEVHNGLLDLNASTNQFMVGTDAGEGLESVSPPHKCFRPSASWSNNANTVRVEKHTSLISHSSLSVSDQHKEVNHLVNKRDIDINLPCDDDSSVVSVDQHGSKAFCVKNKEEGNKAANIRHYFDLNSCASEEDDKDSGLHSSLRVKTKGTFWIDLEAPPTLESEEDIGESLQEQSDESEDGNSLDELIKVAAQAIVSMSLSDHLDDAASSSTDAASKSLLSWFADIIISCGDGSPEEYSSGEIDYFEAMTLSLKPTKEEDYMPEPLVPENLILEGTGLNRPRRGQARRGRPKRDFQRDTLPGLPSLSRQQVAEDIQLFSALMKTKEYTSGVAARQNSKRRKRTITNTSQALVCQSIAEQMNESVSVVGREDSKLTGWGQATRRPRRQRCPPPGNLNMIASEHNGNFPSLVKRYREYN